MTAINHHKILRSLIIVCLVVVGYLGSPLAIQAERGLVLEGEKITDQQGKEVILYKESHALVIGVSDYTHGWPKLPGVQRDVQEVKRVLEEHGFNLVVKMNLDRNALEQAFHNFINEYGHEPDNRLLFYFAGHGHTLQLAYGGEMGYIVPADAPLTRDDKTGFLAKAMDMQMIEVYARRIQSKHALFVFDSCFSGSLFAVSRATPDHITHKTANPVRQFITSGSANEQVPDESIFRQQFIAGLTGEGDKNGDGYVTGAELGIFLEDTVINYSKGAQHPQYGKIRDPFLDKGDFVFKLPEPPAEETTPAPVIPPEISASFDDIEAQLEWQEYLDKMEEAFSKLTRYEELDVPSESKIAAWERFINTFQGEHPYTTRDDELRSTARERITFWKKRSLLTPTPVSTATPQPPTPTPTAIPEPVFRINHVVIKDARGKVIEPVDEIYAVKAGETITITLDVESPPNHTIEATWTTRNGKVQPTSEMTNTYTAQKPGVDYVIIYVWDEDTGDELEEPINITVVPE